MNLFLKKGYIKENVTEQREKLHKIIIFFSYRCHLSKLKRTKSKS